MYKIFSLSVVSMCVLFAGQVMNVEAADMLATSSPATSIVATSTVTLINQTPAEIEKRVREYFVDTPVMIDIALCESKFRQFTDSGNVMRGGSGGMMVGIFQFFESVHSKAAKNLGFDVLTVEGNLGYAKHVYEQSGTTPWSSCVPAVVSTSVSVVSPATTQLIEANKKLKIELLKKVIVLLQELLKMELAKAR